MGRPYLRRKVRWMPSLPHLTLEDRARPFNPPRGAHKLSLQLQVFLALAQVVLHVCERSRATRGTESRVLHCTRRIRVGGDNKVYCINIKGKRLKTLPGVCVRGQL